RLAMKLQQMFGHRSARASLARRRSRRAHLERLEGRAGPAPYTAASGDDLIYAINAAHATAEADTITLAAGKACTLTTVYYSSAADDASAGLPAIAAGEDLTVIGNGAVIERSTNNGGFRFFNVAAGGSLTLQNLTLEGGFTQRWGGALFNQGTLTL